MSRSLSLTDLTSQISSSEGRPPQRQVSGAIDELGMHRLEARAEVCQPVVGACPQLIPEEAQVAQTVLCQAPRFGPVHALDDGQPRGRMLGAPWLACRMQVHIDRITWTEGPVTHALVVADVPCRRETGHVVGVPEDPLLLILLFT